MSDEPSFQQELSVEVKAGQTLVLEIVARQAPTTPTVGSFELLVRDAQNNSVTGQFQLVSKDGNSMIPVNVVEGAGRVDGLSPGDYVLKYAVLGADPPRHTLQNKFEPMGNGTHQFEIRSQESPRIDNRPATIIQNIRGELGTSQNRAWLTAQTANAMTSLAFATLENLILLQALLAELDDPANTIISYSSSLPGQPHTDASPPISSRYESRTEGSFQLGRSVASGPIQWMATVRFTAMGWWPWPSGGGSGQVVDFAISDLGKLFWVAYYAVSTGQPPPQQRPPVPAQPGTLWHVELYHGTLGVIGFITYNQISDLFQKNTNLNPPFQLSTYYGVRTLQYTPHDPGTLLNAIIPGGQTPGDAAWALDTDGTVKGFHIIVTMPPPATM